MSAQVYFFAEKLICSLFAILVLARASAFTQNVKSAGFERIITDFDDVLKGVAIAYSYNESSRDASEYSSVPGCPQSVDGYPWVYYGSPEYSRCYLAGEIGPCEFGQKIFVEKDNPYGYCNCDCFEGVQKATNLDQAQFCYNGPDKEVAFLPRVKKCYKLYSRALCKDNEWLIKVKDTASLVKCETRKCPEGQLPWTNYDTDGSFTEGCRYPFAAYAPAVIVRKEDCEEAGMKYSNLLKKCVKKFDFNIG